MIENYTNSKLKCSREHTMFSLDSERMNILIGESWNKLKSNFSRVEKLYCTNKKCLENI